MDHGRVLALDLGKQRIGLALSDESQVVAQGLETLERTNIREDLARLSQLASDNSVSLIVVGNPLHMSGREGFQAEKAREFGARLQEASSIPVEFWDERLTTVEAHRILYESGRPRTEHRALVDQVAAVIILQGFLDARSSGRGI